MIKTLTPKEIEDIEYEVSNDYVSHLQKQKFSGDTIYGDLQVWTDADDYYNVPGKCYISGDLIKTWITGNFESLIEEYLWKSGKKTTISDLAEPKDLVDRESFVEFLLDQLDNIEEYFWSSDMYSDFCDEYFAENAEQEGPEYPEED